MIFDKGVFYEGHAFLLFDSVDFFISCLNNAPQSVVICGMFTNFVAMKQLRI